MGDFATFNGDTLLEHSETKDGVWVGEFEREFMDAMKRVVETGTSSVKQDQDSWHPPLVRQMESPPTALLFSPSFRSKVTNNLYNGEHGVDVRN